MWYYPHLNIGGVWLCWTNQMEDSFFWFYDMSSFLKIKHNIQKIRMSICVRSWWLVAPYEGQFIVCLYCGKGKGRKCIRSKYFHSSTGHYRPLLSSSQGTAPRCLPLDKLTYVTSCECASWISDSFRTTNIYKI